MLFKRQGKEVLSVALPVQEGQLSDSVEHLLHTEAQANEVPSVAVEVSKVPEEPVGDSVVPAAAEERREPEGVEAEGDEVEGGQRPPPPPWQILMLS